MTASVYEKDFYAWLAQTIKLLREDRLQEIDRDILIDELESMGKRDKRELISHFVILLAHLLKWQFQPDARSAGWVGSIAEQRLQIADQLEDSPSLRNYVPESIEKAYPRAITLAARETGFAPSSFPQSCPYSLRELADEDFYPA
jgi:hypothetical protein